MTIPQDDPRLQAMDQEMLKAAWGRIRTDCAGFIKTFVNIENADTGLPAPFSLWPEQERALKEIQENRLNVILKARQIGLTWLSLAFAIWCMLCRPGFTVSVMSRKEEDAQELVRRCAFILRHLPPWMATYGKKSDKGITWDNTSQTLFIHHPDGEDSWLKAFSSSPGGSRSFTVSLVIIDEWAFQDYADEIWSSAFPTINRPTGGKVIALSTAKRGTLHEETWNNAVTGENEFHPIFLSWKADPRRTKEWYEATKRAIPKSYRAEYPSTPEEAFVVGQGAAFEEWDEDIHVPFDAGWYPPAGWKIYRAYDGGYTSRAACLWIAVDNDGRAIVYREYYPTHIPDPDQAEEIKRLSKTPDGAAENISYTVCDPNCVQKRSGNGIDTMETFARHGIRMIAGSNPRELGWRKVHEWLKPYKGGDGQTTARLLFTKSCANVRRTFPSLTVSKSNPEDVDSDGEDHLADAIRYFVMSRPTAPVSIEERRKRAARRRQKLAPVVSDITGY